jgi:alpha-beta hydrolase superfamily lysophospholipase
MAPDVASALAQEAAPAPGCREVTMRVIPRAGHHLMAEKTAPIFEADLLSWFSAHGF